MTHSTLERPTMPTTRTTDFSDPMTLRRAFGHYPSGVAALAAEIDGAKHVVIASSFMVGISLDPPLVQFAIQNSSQTWPKLREAERIGVSVIGQHQGPLSRQLAGRDRDARFEGVGIDRVDGGAILLQDAPITFECSVYAEYPAGDHEVILLKVEALTCDAETEPIVFHGSKFRELIDRLND